MVDIICFPNLDGERDKDKRKRMLSDVTLFKGLRADSMELPRDPDTSFIELSHLATSSFKGPWECRL